MTTLNKITDSLWFWRIMFFMMAFVALGMSGMYVERPTKTIVKEEYIYLIYDHESDRLPATESRWM